MHDDYEIKDCPNRIGHDYYECDCGWTSNGYRDSSYCYSEWREHCVEALSRPIRIKMWVGRK